MKAISLSLQSSLVVLLLALSAYSYAADEEPIYTGFFSSTALSGYDAVAYFMQGKAVKGADAYAFHWRGARWTFANRAHMMAFQTSPQQYAPQYGGYCAYAMSDGRLVSADPDVFKIHNGKLYLNYNKSVQGHWLAEKELFIQQADGHYPKLVDLTIK
ncbi:YHS domain protein [Saccharobesus litoralis]|uniref:YHS domain protein n=1 Tax=Saccharobesus litoralis TaxID=2172099 RepID=A0A2S0VW13_9ALTE|nr:YHS domain-containing (seleno)protein [Saccharobesus litoralis]AWB68409.1 YHS domain protein [Saccharobesus litoralis]